MKTKKWLIPMITAVLVIIFFASRQYYLDNRVIGYDLYMMYGYDRDILWLDNNLNGVEGNEILEEVLAGFYTWEQLPITEHFKNKFKNRRNILSEIDNIESLYADNEKIDNEDVIFVRANEKQNIFEEYFCLPVTIECYFKYKMDGDKLDDIELIKKRYVDTPTGDLIKEFNIA